MLRWNAAFRALGEVPVLGQPWVPMLIEALNDKNTGGVRPNWTLGRLILPTRAAPSMRSSGT